MRRKIAVLLFILFACLVAANALGTEARDKVRLAKEIALEFFAGDPKKVHEMFSPEIAGLMTADELVELKGMLTDEGTGLGAFESLGEVRQGAAEIIVTAHMAASDLLVIISLTDGDQIAVLYFIRDSIKPEDVPLAENEEEVSFGTLNLPGILTVSEGEKLPAVVLVHGSGENDRNESLIGGTIIFKDIAQGLSERGVAVLRYDKRTYLMNQGILPFTDETIANMTVYEETVLDAIEAVQFLKSDERIDPDRIFVIGHSQGAMMAPCIHNDGADVNGLILLAGTLRTLPELLAEQLEAAPEFYADEIAFLRAIADISEEEARQTAILGQNAYRYWDAAQYDLPGHAERADVPMLILQGTEDQNVFPDRDYPLWEEFQKNHPDRDITCKLYDGLDHLFLEGTQFSSRVLDDIAAWIKTR